jgi:hypothetical protein
MSEKFQKAETYYAGAYWGSRKEPAEECARRVENLLTTLSGVDTSFAQWFQQGRSRKDALSRPIAPMQDVLAKLIRKGRDRQFEDLGFNFWAWNGVCDDYDDSGLQLRCGAYAESVSNSCLVQLPRRGPNAERVLTASVLVNLVRSMALAWEPDWAVAMSRTHRELLGKKDSGEAWVGWVTYLSLQRGRVPPLPAPVRIEPVEDRGTLILLTPERFTADNAEHVALSLRVRELLERAGLLGPRVC